MLWGCRYWLRSKALRSLAKILQYPSDSLQEFLDYALNEAIRLTGSKIGYLIATIEYGLQHAELGDEFRSYLQSLPQRIGGGFPPGNAE